MDHKHISDDYEAEAKRPAVEDTDSDDVCPGCGLTGEYTGIDKAVGNDDLVRNSYYCVVCQQVFMGRWL